jgi:hypothetical protein
MPRCFLKQEGVAVATSKLALIRTSDEVTPPTTMDFSLAPSASAWALFMRLGCAVGSPCVLEIIGGVVGLDGRQRRSLRQLIHSYLFRSRTLATTFRCGL